MSRYWGPLLSWCQESFDPRLNGILLNWFDASLGHYMGAHRDSTINMLEGTPIITVSLGETRKYRLRPWKASGKQDFQARHGNVFVVPYDTNQAGRTKFQRESDPAAAASRLRCGPSTESAIRGYLAVATLGGEGYCQFAG